MKVNDIRKLGDDDIVRELTRRQSEMVKLNFNKTAGNLSDHTEIRKLRRTIAKIKTVVREREIIKETQ